MTYLMKLYSINILCEGDLSNDNAKKSVHYAWKGSKFCREGGNNKDNLSIILSFGLCG